MEQKSKQNIDIGPNTTDAVSISIGTGKKSKVMLIGMIICAVLAVGGVGFGVYEYLNPRVVVKTESVSVVDSAVKAENTQNYIYIGDWGVKIRIPETVKDVSYVFETYERPARRYSSVYVNGHSSEDPTNYYSTQPYDDSESLYNPNGKGAISIHEIGDECEDKVGESTGRKYGTDCGIIINIGGEQKAIQYSGIQDSWWSRTNNEIEAGKLIVQNWNFEERITWEVRAVDAIKEMLTNPENYSAI